VPLSNIFLAFCGYVKIGERVINIALSVWICISSLHREHISRGGLVPKKYLSIIGWDISIIDVILNDNSIKGGIGYVKEVSFSIGSYELGFW